MAFGWGEKLPNTTSFIRHRAAETLRQDEMEKGRWEDREESGRTRWERSFQKLQDVQLGPITAALIATNHCLMLRQAIRHGCLSGRAERMGKLAPPIKTSARRKREHEKMTCWTRRLPSDLTSMLTSFPVLPLPLAWTIRSSSESRDKRSKLLQPHAGREQNREQNNRNFFYLEACRHALRQCILRQYNRQRGTEGPLQVQT